MEKVMIDHPFHEHSLILKKSVGNEESVDCYVCRFRIGNGEVYTCVQGKQCRSSSSEIIFHKRCGELPTQISLPSIHRHPLYLVDSHAMFFKICNVCRRLVFWELGYRCSRCSFYVDMRCKEKVENESPRESTRLKHHCHAHPLSLLRMPPSLFSCDGCGTEDHDMAYACTTCGFLVHKTCALLPPLLPTTHHPHQLSLSSTLSLQFRCFSIECNLCFGGFDFVSWVYHCSDCRFFAHLRCVTSVLELPLEERDVYNKLIRPFLILELNKILGVTDMTRPITKEEHSLLFNFSHMHDLSFVYEEEEDEEEEEEEDGFADDVDLIKFGEDLSKEEILDAPGEVIGKSSYGTLYRASLVNSGSVAVLRFLRPSCTLMMKDVMPIVEMLGCLRHPNLVPLNAFYKGPRGEKLMVHPFYASGNLAQFITDGRSEVERWPLIHKISVGIAEGIGHLHSARDNPIIHGNLKSKNVFLDEHHRPHISDFGLHLLLNPTAGQQMLEASASQGYRAPELIKMKDANKESDIYSLGNLLLELVCGKSPLDQDLDSLVNALTQDRLLRFFKLAMACCSPSPHLRPHIHQILEKLKEIAG